MLKLIPVFFVSKTHLKWPGYGAYLDSYVAQWAAKKDEKELVLIRLVLMNPFFDTIQTETAFPEEFVEELKRELTRA